VPLARVRSDLSPALSDAIDLTLAPVPEQRQVTARQLVELIERELPAVLESAELRWNIEIFQALSLFTPSTSPPPSTRPIDFQPKARPRLISRHPAPEISAPPATVEIPTLRRPAGADGTSSPATREDWPRPLDELDVPTMEPSTRRRPGRDDAADDDDLSAADEPRTHVMERPDFDAMKRPGPTLVSPSSDDRDDDGALAPVAPPDADLSQPAVVPRVKTHTLVSESSPPRDEVSVTTAPLSPAGAAPAGHTPAPGASAPAATPTPAAPTPPPAAAPAATAAAPGEATVAASRPLSTPQGVPRRSKLPYIAMAAVALIGGATLGWFVLSRNDAGGETAAETDSTASPGATTQASAPATSKAAGSDAPAAPSAPAGATSAAPRAAASGSAALATDAGDDLSGLLSYEGYLVVQSSTKADVYVQGVRVGETNTRIKSRCYRRFVRLKDGASDAWLTTGQPVQIECMKVTRVRIEP